VISFRQVSPLKLGMHLYFILWQPDGRQQSTLSTSWRCPLVRPKRVEKRKRKMCMWVGKLFIICMLLTCIFGCKAESRVWRMCTFYWTKVNRRDVTRNQYEDAAGEMWGRGAILSRGTTAVKWSVNYVRMCVYSLISAADAKWRPVILISSMLCTWNSVTAPWERSARVHISVLLAAGLSLSLSLSLLSESVNPVEHSGYFMYRHV
jgi:hypothetical protein